MKIPTKEYSVKAFTNELIRLALPSYQRLKIACFMTSFSQWYDKRKMINLEGIFHRYGFRIQKLGEIRRIQARYFDSQLNDYKLAIFYSYLDPRSKLLVCFTDERAEAINKTLGDMAESAKGFYYLFVSARTFEKLKEEILSLDPFAKCTHFDARYAPQLTRKSQIRPDIRKTIRYYGEDGLESLQELRQYYGVYPTVMTYHVTERGYYEINNSGMLSSWGGESQADNREFLLSLSNTAIEDVLITRDIIETSNYEVIPVKTERKTFRIPRLTPWVVRFSQEIEFIDSDALIEVMTDNGFSLFNEVRTKGSVRLNGMVIDDRKQTMFSIDVDSAGMSIAPVGESRFDSFMRFYRTVLENFDPNARCARFQA